MDRLLKDLTDAEPDSNGQHFPCLDHILEQALIQRIENGAEITELNRATASRLLFFIWKEARRVVELYDGCPTSYFDEENACSNYVDTHLDIIPLLIEVHKKKAYLWLFSNLAASIKEIVSGPVAGIPNPNAALKTSPLLDDEDVEIILTTDVEPRLRRALTTYLDEDARLPIWQPESGSKEMRVHISNLEIPRRSYSSSPSLLLHRLGQLSHDSELIERIKKLFRAGSQYKFLCNTSGSGKTRLLLEGLCQHWGLYFTAQTQPDGIGSRDLENMLEALEREYRLIKLTVENHAIALDANREVTSRQFLLLLFVRLLVLRIFLQCAFRRAGGIKEEHKQQWLLLQVAPELLAEPDIFFKQTQKFEKASLSYLESSVKNELRKIHKILGKSLALFCVLDEAQVPVNMSLDCFRSEKNETRPRPVLREIISSWKSWLPNLIISGTGVSMQEVEIIFGSAVGKEGDLKPDTFTDLGAFDNENSQHAYLKQYLPPDALDTHHWKDVATRVGYWLHGRYRFTATYISRLIQANFDAPHEVLDNFVEGLTGFRPSDRGDGHGVTAKVAKLSGFDFSKLEKDEPLLRQIAGFIFDYVFHGKPRDLGGPNNEKLVEYGVARFGFHKDIVANEPLALLAAVGYFPKTNWSLEYFLLEAVTSSHDSARGSAFEHFSAYILGMAFKSPTPLSQVFSFVGHVSKDLEDESGQLVAMEKVDGSFKCHPVDISSNTGPTYRLGHTCQSAEETLAWLQNPQRTAFCYPANKVGPNLILVLKLSDETLLRVLFQFKQRFDLTMSRMKIANALGTTDPSQSVSPRATPALTGQPNDDSSMHAYLNNPLTSKGLLQQALLDLGTGTQKAGRFSVLRVLMTYPTAPNPQILAELADEDKDRHPAATVDVEKLAKGDPQDGYLESLKQRLQDTAMRRKRKAGNDVPGPNPKRKG